MVGARRLLVGVRNYPTGVRLCLCAAAGVPCWVLLLALALVLVSRAAAAVAASRQVRLTAVRTVHAPFD